MTGFKFKALFFDSPAVVRAIDAASRKVLSQAGAFVRSTAQRSMPYRKKSATPGQPPSAHRGNPLLRKLLFFGLDLSNKSVVIGPTKSRGGFVPRLMEEGGTIPIRDGHRTKLATYRPHPYMGPALSAELKKTVKRFSGSVHT